MDIDTAVYLLRYDSVYGAFEEPISHDGTHIFIGDQAVSYTAFEDSRQCDFQADIVYECSGVYRTKERCKHYLDAADLVIVSAPPQDDLPIYVVGVNEHAYGGEPIISCSSCTANAVAPVIKLLDALVGVKRGTVTVVHSYTSDQSLLDGQQRNGFRISRAAGLNMIPLTSSVASEVMRLFSHITMAGINLRVPLLNSMMLNLMLELKEPMDPEYLKKSVSGYRNGIVSIKDDAFVSRDIRGFGESAVIDGTTIHAHENLLYLQLYQDNERAYAMRLLDLVQLAKEQ
jgi:glyceraldehyde 3-phosphate dehydrogenase